MATFSADKFADMLRSLDAAQKYDELAEEKVSIANIVSTAQIGNFDRESDALGNPWAPRKHNYNHPPLRDTLAMYAAASDPYADGHVRKMGFREVTIGIDDDAVPYAKFQQYGTSSIPARQFMYLREEDFNLLVAPMLSGLARIMQDNARKYASGNTNLSFSDSGGNRSAGAIS